MSAPVHEHVWLVMGPSPRTRDGAMPCTWFYCHDQAAEWALRFPECWLEPGIRMVLAPDLTAFGRVELPS